MFYDLGAAWAFRLTLNFTAVAAPVKPKLAALYSPQAMFPTRCCELEAGKYYVEFDQCFQQPVPPLPCAKKRGAPGRNVSKCLGYDLKDWEVQWWST